MTTATMNDDHLKKFDYWKAGDWHNAFDQIIILGQTAEYILYRTRDDNTVRARPVYKGAPDGN